MIDLDRPGSIGLLFPLRRRNFHASTLPTDTGHRPIGSEMLILDRYLLRQFAQNFLACFVSLTGLFVVVDLVGNVDDLQRAAEAHGGFWSIVGEYYGYRTIGFFDRTSGILTLIAAMFSMAMFQRFNELTAIQAAGVSKRRIVKPIVLAVLAITAVAVANRELVIAAVRDRYSRNAQDLFGEVGKDMQQVRDLQTDVIIGGRKTYANQQRIEAANFTLRGAKLTEYGRQISAANAFYQSADKHHPAGYLLQGVIAPKDLANKPSLSIDRETIIYTPLENNWLAPNECFIRSDVTFEHLASRADFRANASIVELIRGLKNPSLGFGADMRTAIHARIVQPFLDVTLLFLGLPLILARSNRNMFVAIGWCVVVVVLFYLVVLGCQYLGSSYLVSPSLAAWLPVFAFVPTAVWMSEPLRE
ncbi:MAG: LptF/LptG family permease [Pirellulales bacterium]|nr:LptF/LptG family permease [Pirellulales bacterium]